MTGPTYTPADLHAEDLCVICERRPAPDPAVVCVDCRGAIVNPDLPILIGQPGEAIPTLSRQVNAVQFTGQNALALAEWLDTTRAGQYRSDADHLAVLVAGVWVTLTVGDWITTPPLSVMSDAELAAWMNA